MLGNISKNCKTQHAITNRGCLSLPCYASKFTISVAKLLKRSPQRVPALLVGVRHLFFPASDERSYQKTRKSWSTTSNIAISTKSLYCGPPRSGIAKGNATCRIHSIAELPGIPSSWRNRTVTELLTGRAFLCPVWLSTWFLGS